MERSVSAFSEQNIRDHCWRLSTLFRPSIFDKPVHCPTFLHLCREFGKEMKKKVKAIPLGRPGSTGIPAGDSVQHNLKHPYVSLRL